MRRPRFFTSGLLAAAVVALACASLFAPETESEKAAREAAELEKTKREVYSSMSADEERGFDRKRPPKGSEWLVTNKEKAQSVEQYRGTYRIRPTDERKTISLQPLGEMNADQKKLMEILREYTEAFFQLPARIEKPIELVLDKPGKELTRAVPLARQLPGYTKQYNADVILDSILPQHLPKDAVVSLGITMQDLYSGRMNYVFGLGSMRDRVGVYSLVRYFPEFFNIPRSAGSEKLALLRSCKVLNHEAGHMFGLPHCVFYECSMNGSNSLNESDENPIHFCPVCHRKLMLNLGCDEIKRFEDLKTFYGKHGFKDEAAFMEAQLKLARKNASTEKARKTGEE